MTHDHPKQQQLRGLPPLPLLPLLAALTMSTTTATSRGGDEGWCPLTIGATLHSPLRLTRTGSGGESVLLLERPRAYAVVRSALTAVAAAQQQQQQGSGAAAPTWLAVLAPFLLPCDATMSLSAGGGGRLAPPPLLSDGHGRLVLLLSAALDSLHRGGGGEMVGGAGSLGFAAGFFSPSSSIDDCDESSRSRRRLLQTLRRMSRASGLVVPFSGRCCDGTGADMAEDWLDAACGAARADLSSRSDLCRADDGPATRGRASARTVLAGALHTVMATEVEGAALRALAGLLVDHLVPPMNVDDDDGVGDTGTDGASPWTGLAVIRRRLAWLVAAPHSAFSCSAAFSAGGGSSPFSSSVRAAAAAARAACPGPVASSQLVPADMILLPFEDEEEEEGLQGIAANDIDGGVLDKGRRLPWFFLPSAASDKSKTDSSNTTTIAAAPVRVLLLRIDPAGDWLPPEEDAYNTQSFFRYYENDTAPSSGGSGRGGGARRLAMRRHWADASSSSDENEHGNGDRYGGGGGGHGAACFEAMAARAQGRREVSAAVVGPSTSASGHATNSNGKDDEDDDQESIVRRLTAALAGGTDRDRRLLSAALRLYGYAARHGVDVIVTPERAPRGWRRFSALYGEVLAAFLPPMGGGGGDDCDGTTSVKYSGVGAVKVPCIRLLDCVRLADFMALQARVGVGGGAAPAVPPPSSHQHPRLPLLLCRDCLRPGAVTTATAAAAMPPGPAHRRRSDVGGGDDGPVFAAAAVVVTPFSLLLRRPLTQVRYILSSSSTGALELLPPPSIGARGAAQLGPRLCLIQLLPPLKEGEEVEEASGHAVDTAGNSASYSPSSSSMLVVAPTQALAARYELLLLKGAQSLASLLGSEPLQPLTMATTEAPQLRGGNASADCVRAGGAAFVSLAVSLRRLAVQLRALAVSQRQQQQQHHREGAVARAATVDPAMASLALGLLSTACLSVPTALAEGFITAAAATGGEKKGKGPRTLRRLWALALQEAMSPSVEATRPQLHVCCPSAAEVARRRCEGAGGDGGCRAAGSTACGAAIAAFGCAPAGEDDDDDDNDGHGGGGGGALLAAGRGSPAALPFIEPFSVHASLLRALAHALYSVLAAT